MNLAKYIDDDDRWHEQGHVWGFGLVTLGLSFMGWLAPILVLIGSIAHEIWVDRAPNTTWDFWYDVYTKGVMGPAWGYFIIWMINPSGWEHLWLSLFAIGSYVLPYKFKL